MFAVHCAYEFCDHWFSFLPLTLILRVLGLGSKVLVEITAYNAVRINVAYRTAPAN